MGDSVLSLDSTRMDNSDKTPYKPLFKLGTQDKDENINSLTYHPELNCLVAITELSVKLIDPTFGYCLKTVPTATSQKEVKPVKCFYHWGSNSIIVAGSNGAISQRRPYHGTLLLPSLFQTSVKDDSELITLDMHHEEAVQLQNALPEIKLQSNLSLKLNYKEFTKALEDAIKDCEDNSSKSKLPEHGGIDRNTRFLKKYQTVSISMPANLILDVLTSILPQLFAYKIVRSPYLSLVASLVHRTKLLISKPDSPINLDLEIDSPKLIENMRSEEERLKSFKRWPHMEYKWALPAQMAEAGFFHQPVSKDDDRAMCFSCSVCLVYWEPSDEPWSEHERHSATCPFVKGNSTQNIPLSFSLASSTAVAMTEQTREDESPVDMLFSAGDFPDYIASATVEGEVVMWHMLGNIKKALSFSVSPKEVEFFSTEFTNRHSDKCLDTLNQNLDEGDPVFWDGVNTPTNLSPRNSNSVEDIVTVVPTETEDEVSNSEEEQIDTDCDSVKPSLDEMIEVQALCMLCRADELQEYREGVLPANTVGENLRFNMKTAINGAMQKKQHKTKTVVDYCRPLLVVAAGIHKDSLSRFYDTRDVNLVECESYLPHLMVIDTHLESQCTRMNKGYDYEKEEVVGKPECTQLIRIPTYNLRTKVKKAIQSQCGNLLLVLIERSQSDSKSTEKNSLLIYSIKKCSCGIGFQIITDPLFEHFYPTSDDTPVDFIGLPTSKGIYNDCNDDEDEGCYCSFAAVCRDGSLRIYDLGLSKLFTINELWPPSKASSDKSTPVKDEDKFHKICFFHLMGRDKLAVTQKNNSIILYNIGDLLEENDDEDSSSNDNNIPVEHETGSTSIFDVCQEFTKSVPVNSQVLVNVPVSWNEITRLSPRNTKNHPNSLGMSDNCRTWILESKNSDPNDSIMEVILFSGSNIQKTKHQKGLLGSLSLSFEFLENPQIDMEVSLLMQDSPSVCSAFDQTSSSTNRCTTKTFQDAYNASLICGPLSVFEHLDLSGRTATIILTCPEVFCKRESYHYLVHIGTANAFSTALTDVIQPNPLKIHQNYIPPPLSSGKPADGSDILLGKKRSFGNFIKEVTLNLNIVSANSTDIRAREKFLNDTLMHNNIVEMLVESKSVKTRVGSLDLLLWLLTVHSPKSKQTDCIHSKLVTSILGFLPDLIAKILILGNRTCSKKIAQVFLMIIQKQEFYSDNISNEIALKLLEKMNLVQSSPNAAAISYYFLLLNLVKSEMKEAVAEKLTEFLTVTNSAATSRKHSLARTLFDSYGVEKCPMTGALFHIPPSCLYGSFTEGATGIKNDLSRRIDYSPEYSYSYSTLHYPMPRYHSDKVKAEINQNAEKIDHLPAFHHVNPCVNGLVEAEPLHFTLDVANDGSKQNASDISVARSENPRLTTVMEDFYHFSYFVNSSSSDHGESDLNLLKDLVSKTESEMDKLRKTLAFVSEDELMDGKGINEEEKNDFEENSPSGETADDSVGDDATSDNSLWQSLLKPVPNLYTSNEKYNTGAAKFIILDFGSPVILTDIIMPCNPELSALAIDTWLTKEHTDGVKIATCNDIHSNNLIISDMNSAEPCRFMKISFFMKSSPPSNDGLNLPLGNFYGHRVLLPFVTSKPGSLMKEAQKTLKIAFSLRETVNTQYNTACSKLKSLLTKSQFLRDETSKGDILKACQECATGQRYLTVIGGMIRRLQEYMGINKPVKTFETLDVSAFEDCPYEKINFLQDHVLLSIISFGPDSLSSTNPISKFLSTESAHQMFRNVLNSNNPFHQHLLNYAFLIFGSHQPWFGSFFISTFVDTFTSSATYPTNFASNARAFKLLSYLSQRCIDNNNSSLVLNPILKTLLNRLGSDSTSDKDSNWSLVQWLILLLSRSLNHFMAVDDCKIGIRWNWVSGEAHMTQPLNRNLTLERERKKTVMHQYYASIGKPVASAASPSTNTVTSVLENMRDFWFNNFSPFSDMKSASKKASSAKRVKYECPFDRPMALSLAKSLLKTSLPVKHASVDVFVITLKVVAVLCTSAVPVISLFEVLTSDSQLDDIITEVAKKELQWPQRALVAFLVNVLQSQDVLTTKLPEVKQASAPNSSDSPSSPVYEAPFVKTSKEMDETDTALMSHYKNMMAKGDAPCPNPHLTTMEEYFKMSLEKMPASFLNSYPDNGSMSDLLCKKDVAMSNLLSQSEAMATMSFHQDVTLETASASKPVVGDASSNSWANDPLLDTDAVAKAVDHTFFQYCDMDVENEGLTDYSSDSEDLESKKKSLLTHHSEESYEMTHYKSLKKAANNKCKAVLKIKEGEAAKECPKTTSLYYSSTVDQRITNTLLLTAEINIRKVFRINCQRIYGALSSSVKAIESNPNKPDKVKEPVDLSQAGPSSRPDPVIYSSGLLVKQSFDRLFKGTFEQPDAFFKNVNYLSLYHSLVNELVPQSEVDDLKRSSIEPTGQILSTASVKSIISSYASTSDSIRPSHWLKLFRVLNFVIDDKNSPEICLNNSDFKCVVIKFLTDINCVGALLCELFRKLISSLVLKCRCLDPRNANGNAFKCLLLEIFLEILPQSGPLDSRCIFHKILHFVPYAAVGRPQLLLDVIKTATNVVYEYKMKQDSSYDIVNGDGSISTVSWATNMKIDRGFEYSMPFVDQEMYLIVQVIRSLILAPIADPNPKFQQEMSHKKSKESVCNHFMDCQFVNRLVADSIVEDYDIMSKLLKSLVFPLTKNQSVLNASLHCVLNGFNRCLSDPRQILPHILKLLTSSDLSLLAMKSSTFNQLLRSVLDCQMMLTSFIELGGATVLWQNYCQCVSNNITSDRYSGPAVISELMSQILPKTDKLSTKNSKLRHKTMKSIMNTYNFYESDSEHEKLEKLISRVDRKMMKMENADSGIEGDTVMYNVATFATVALNPSLPNVKNCNVIINAGHRGKASAWTHSFSKESHVNMVFTLPCDMLISEVVVHSTDASCLPKGVTVKVGHGETSSLVPVTRPSPNSTRLRLGTPTTASTVVVTFYKSENYNHIGVTEVEIFATSAFKDIQRAQHHRDAVELCHWWVSLLLHCIVTGGRGEDDVISHGVAMEESPKMCVALLMCPNFVLEKNNKLEKMAHFLHDNKPPAKIRLDIVNRKYGCLKPLEELILVMSERSSLWAQRFVCDMLHNCQVTSQDWPEYHSKLLFHICTHNPKAVEELLNCLQTALTSPSVCLSDSVLLITSKIIWHSKEILKGRDLKLLLDSLLEMQATLTYDATSLNQLVCSVCYVQPDLFKKVSEKCFTPSNTVTSESLSKLEFIVNAGLSPELAREILTTKIPNLIVYTLLEWSNRLLRCRIRGSQDSVLITNRDVETMTKMLNLLSLMCSERLLQDWMGSGEGAVIWETLLTLLSESSISDILDISLSSMGEGLCQLISATCLNHPDNQLIIAKHVFSLISRQRETDDDVGFSHSLSGFTKNLIAQVLLKEKFVDVLIHIDPQIALESNLRKDWLPVNSNSRLYLPLNSRLGKIPVDTKIIDIISELTGNKAEVEGSTEQEKINCSTSSSVLDASGSNQVSKVSKREFSKCTYMVRIHGTNYSVPYDYTLNEVVMTLQSLSLFNDNTLQITVEKHDSKYTTLSSGEPLECRENGLFIELCNQGLLSSLAKRMSIHYPDVPSVIPGEKFSLNSGLMEVAPHILGAFTIFLRLEEYGRCLMKDGVEAMTILKFALDIDMKNSLKDLKENRAAEIVYGTLDKMLLNESVDTTSGMKLRSECMDIGVVHYVLCCLCALTSHSHPDLPHRLQQKNVQVAPIIETIKTWCIDFKSKTKKRPEGRKAGQPKYMSSIPTGQGESDRNLYWAKGTGFGTGSTIQNWNIEQAVAKQKLQEKHIIWLLRILSRFIYIDEDEEVKNGNLRKIDSDSEVKNDWILFSSQFSSVLGSSLIMDRIASYLTNDSVLDLNHHVPLYLEILFFVSSIACNKELSSLLFNDNWLDDHQQHNGILQLLQNMLKTVDIYTSKVECNSKSGKKKAAEPSEKKKSRGSKYVKMFKHSKESFTVDVLCQDEQEEGMKWLLESLIETVELVEEANTEYLSTTNRGLTGEDISNSERIKDLELFETSEDIYVKALKDLQFDSFEMTTEEDGNLKITVDYVFSNHIRNQGSMLSHNRLKRLAQETVTLSNSLPLSYSSSVFARTDSDRLDMMKIMIVGPEDTPYANGLFEFDVHFPHDYPNHPPMIKLRTTGGGTVRFNPNLYQDGKVCLSILNTWHGRPEEKWNSQTSSLLQVLVSIQSLILVPEPYFNEPGYERSRGTPVGTHSSREYDSNIMVNNLRFAMLDHMINPSLCFKEVIDRHFYLKQHDIERQVKFWISQMESPAFDTKKKKSPVRYKQFIKNLNKFLAEFKARVKTIEVPPEMRRAHRVCCENPTPESDSKVKDSENLGEGCSADIESEETNSKTSSIDGKTVVTAAKEKIEEDNKSTPLVGKIIDISQSSSEEHSSKSDDDSFAMSSPPENTADLDAMDSSILVTVQSLTSLAQAMSDSLENATQAMSDSLENAAQGVSDLPESAEQELSDTPENESDNLMDYI